MHVSSLRSPAAVLAALVTTLVLALGVAPARALNTHVFSKAIGATGTGAGEFEAPSGVAVNNASHDVYIADTGNHRIDEFAADGTFVRAWGWGVADGLPVFEACTLFCQAGLSGSGPGELSTPRFVAVDNSADLSAGDVYVGDAGDNKVSKFTAEGALVESWGVKGQLDGSTTTHGSFGSLAGVEVASGGVLDVLSTAKLVFEFGQNGTFSPPEVGIGERETEANGLAVDGAGDFFKVNGDGSVEELTGSGRDVGQVSPNSVEGQYAQGLAAAGGDLYIADLNAVRHYVFSEPGHVVEAGGASCIFEPHAPCRSSDSFGSSESNGGGLTAGSGIGVDSSSDAVYVADTQANRLDVFLPGVLPDVKTEPPTGFSPTSVILNGTVNPDGVEVTDCHFDYGTTTAYGQIIPCAQTVGSGTGEVAVTAKLTGLEPGTTYHFRLQAENANKTPSFGEDMPFAPPPPPAISGELATGLTATGVDLNATINPGGLPTTYQFQWGASTSYGNVAPSVEEGVGAGTVGVARTQHVTGLSHDTLYHWRVVATNAAGTTIGVDHTFIYTTGGGGLPDNRAYEMVTPPVKNAALIGDVFLGLPPDFAADGSRLVLSTLQCFGDAGSCKALHGGTGTSYAFSREHGGWVASELAPSSTQFEISAVETVNADTGSALFSAPTPPTGQHDFYARQLDGSLADIGPVTPPELGPGGPGLRGTYATADLSHVLFKDRGAGSERWPVDESGSTLLEYVRGVSQPVVVGVRGGAGSHELISVCNTEQGRGIGFGESASATALSADGSKVYFTAYRCPAEKGHAEVPANELYARINESETVKISGSECGPGGLLEEVACRGAAPADATFEGASVDGSKAFFTSTQQLTDSASEDSSKGDTAERCKEAGGNGCNLYEYDFANPAGQRLVTVSAGDTSGGGPRVQGVVAVAGDGSHVYFAARGVLSAASNSQGAKAQDGKLNLYVFERDSSHPGGVVRYVATLSDVANHVEDSELWDLFARANVSSDGRFLVFRSIAPLTRDDTRADGGAAQVFRYDAVTGELVRVSIGAQGFNDNGNAGVGDARIVDGGSVMAFAGGSGRRDPTMSDDGRRVFFMSPVGLTPGALNDVLLAGTEGVEYAENVYEWEQEGAGSCPAGQSVGCVFLISDGRDVASAVSASCGFRSSVCLLGTDVSGSNVFFTTADQLVPGDVDTQVDFYDARICSSGDPCITSAPPPLQPCLGEACHGIPPATPGAPNAPSATFNGAGNVMPSPPAVVGPLTRAQKFPRALRVCRAKRDRRKRVVCERQARKRYGAVRGAVRGAKGRRK